jgi:hypothetical protein
MPLRHLWPSDSFAYILATDLNWVSKRPKLKVGQVKKLFILSHHLSHPICRIISTGQAWKTRKT